MKTTKTKVNNGNQFMVNKSGIRFSGDTEQDEREMRQSMGRQLIDVPDEEIGIEFIEDSDSGESDQIAVLQKILEEAGPDALTEEERAILAAYAANESESKEGSEKHDANLAEFLSEQQLTTIANNVIRWVDIDERGREDWYKREKEGIVALGIVKDDKEPPFKGASDVIHPAFAEAIIQFSARALDALWPAGGPVKSVVLGKSDSERAGQAKRVEQFMNYQYTELIPGAFEQTDKMLVRLPVSGSLFTKCYPDPIDGVTRTLVEPADFIVPYGADDLQSAPRYTERMELTQNDMRKRQVAGYYRDIKLSRPTGNLQDTNDRSLVKDKIDQADGLSDTSGIDADGQYHVGYECVCELDLPGFEDASEDGEPTGIALPYIVTVEKDSQKVLSIYRNWREEDVRKRRIVYHTHYRFMPGLGFYGYGLYHWIGGLFRVATGATRSLLDAAAFSNLQGGYRSKDAGLKNGDDIIGPGEWRDVDCDAQDLAKAFHQINYKEPSATLFNLLAHIEQLSQRFTSTTEAMIGDGAQNTPVGTILARIEQGSKVYTGILKRLHRSAGDEFRLIAWLNSLYQPDEYPFAVDGEDYVVLRQDFDSRVDVIPVSDPNYVSNMQRYFIAQSALELAASAPQFYDMRALHKRVLESLKMDGIEELMPDQNMEPVRTGPVEEGAQLITGKPVKAFPEQAHQAHIQIHQSLLMQLGEKHPASSGIQSHIQEHIALNYLMQMQAMMGVSLINETGEEVPQEIENQMAMAVAEAVGSMAPKEPDIDPVAAEQARKDAATKADIQRKDADAAAKINREDIKAQAQLEKDAEAFRVKEQIRRIEQKQTQLAGGVNPP